MKKIMIALCVAFIAMTAFNNNNVQPGITGTIEPAEGAKQVWAISGTDSVAATPVAGRFSLSVKPGNWLLVVEANKPYKNAVLQNILVLEGNPTDAGVIKLEMP